MDLGYGLIKPLSHLLFYRLKVHLVGKIRLFIFAKGTELTEIGTDVRIINMLIIDKIGVIPVLSIADNIGHIAKG